MIVRVGQIVRETEAEGPGKRYALWFQGCPMRCPSCCNPELLPFAGGTERTVGDILTDIAAADVEGISLLGGEPLAHASSAVAIAKGTRALNRSVMVYSGYTLTEAMELPDPTARELLSLTDVFVDGRYDLARPDSKRRWIGSTNQQIHFFTDRYSPTDPCWTKPNTLELRLIDGTLTVNGFPAPAAVGLWKRLGSAGVSVAVSRFEARLLTILRAILRVTPIDSALAAFTETSPAPPGLGPEALGLVCSDLSQACVQYLIEAGGWKTDRFLRSGKAETGRIWERSPLADRKLVFSQHAVDFLVWLTAHDPRTPKRWVPEFAEWTVADQLLIYLTYDGFRETEVGVRWHEWSAFARNGLCRLAYAGDFVGLAGQPPEFGPWVTGLGAVILEAVQGPLAERWLAAERAKRHVADWGQMKALGAAQELTLDLFAAAVSGAERWDLERFLLKAAVGFYRPAVRPSDLIGGLQGGGNLRLAQRYDVHSRAAALLRFLLRMADEERRARGIGYVDEGYAAAQLFKSDWEAAEADTAVSVARAVLAELVPAGETT